MLIFSFGSGFNLETTNATYLAQIAAGAHSVDHTTDFAIAALTHMY